MENIKVKTIISSQRHIISKAKAMLNTHVIITQIDISTILKNELLLSIKIKLKTIYTTKLGDSHIWMAW